MIQMFHHLAQLPSQFCQIPIGPRRIGQTLEHQNTRSQPNLGPRPPVSPCRMELQVGYVGNCFHFLAFLFLPRRNLFRILHNFIERLSLFTALGARTREFVPFVDPSVSREAHIEKMTNGIKLPTRPTSATPVLAPKSNSPSAPLCSDCYGIFGSVNRRA